MSRKEEAKLLVEAYDAAEALHADAVAMPQGRERDAALIKSSQAKSRAADLQRAYSQKYMGGYSLDGREMGESRADYLAASMSFTTNRLMKALEDARLIVGSQERFAVEIEFEKTWVRVRDGFLTRDDAEWSIAVWRQKNGSNGHDTGFRVVACDREGNAIGDGIGSHPLKTCNTCGEPSMACDCPQ